MNNLLHLQLSLTLVAAVSCSDDGSSSDERSRSFPGLDKAEFDPDRKLTGYNSSHFGVDGRLFISESSEDFSTSTLLDISRDEPEPGPSFPGYAGNLLRDH